MASHSRLVTHRIPQRSPWPVLALIVVLLSPRAWAEGSVTSCDEANLRAALVGGGIVTFACDGTVVLTDTLIIATNTALDASGRSVVISGSNAVRLFVIQQGATLDLQHLTLADGCALGTNGNPRAAGGAGDGGAIYNYGVLLAQGCLFSRNKAQGGTGGVQFGQAAGRGGIGRGGVVFNAGSSQIVASNCQFTLNHAFGGMAGSGPSSVAQGGDASGGVIYNAAGSIHLNQCLILSNRVVSGQGRRFGTLSSSGLAYGGAMVNIGGSVTLLDNLLLGNACAAEFLSGANGGAIYHNGGTLDLANCRLTSNRALAGRGLGISTPSGLAGGHAFGGALSIPFGQARLTQTTLDNNLAVGGAEPGGGSRAGSGFGGALFNSGSVQISNCTVSANQAQSGLARPSLPLHGRAVGGAACNDGGIILLTHGTLSENAASHSGGGTVGNFLGGGIFSTNGTITLRNSIVANSLSGSNFFGETIVDGGHNISSDSSGNFSAPGSLNNTNPVLGPLADFGGPTPTMALLAGSPALDAADPASCLPTDQRGLARPFGAGCDIGAFESAPPYTIVGQITGYTSSPGGTSVSAGSNSSQLDSIGTYNLSGLPMGTYAVKPAASDAVFILSNRVVTVGPDIVNVDFHSYRSNALTIERMTSQTFRSVFAAGAGETWRILGSSNLLDWTPISTNTVTASGIFEFLQTNNQSNPPRFLQTTKP